MNHQQTMEIVRLLEFLFEQHHLTPQDVRHVAAVLLARASGAPQHAHNSLDLALRRLM